MDAYLNTQRKELADREDMLAGIRLDDNLLDADEPFIVEDSIFEDLQQKSEDFHALCGFTINQVQFLYHEAETILYIAKRGRKRVIGLQDDFFIFLHWLRSTSPTDSIAGVFGLGSPTLNTHFHKTGKAIQKILVERYIKSQRESPLHAPVKYPECGFIVDATVQKRGRPTGSFEGAKRFFCRKHWIYYLKSQVVTSRWGMRMYITAGIPWSVYDLALFRGTQDQVTKLVTSKLGEPTKILADKRYIGFREDHSFQLVTGSHDTTGQPTWEFRQIAIMR
jgi:hypothetical protein